MEPEIQFTVKKTAKLQIEKARDPRPSGWLSFFKWLFAGFLCISVLACVVTSKISLLAIGVYYNETRLPVKTNVGHNPSAKETTFIMMVLILMIPQFFSFVKAVFVSLFRHSHSWPTNSAIIWCLVAGFMEVAGLSFFLVVIVLKSSMTASHGILIMNALFVVPIIWQLVKLRDSITNHRFAMAFLVVALVLQIAGIVLITYHVVEKKNLIEFAGIPVSLLFLSFAWCPKIQKLQIKPRNEDPLHEMSFRNDLSTSMPSTAGIPGPSTANPYQSMNNGIEELAFEPTARGKSTIIASFWKLFLTPFVAALFCYAFHVADLHPSSLRGGFKNFDKSHVIYHFVAQIITSLLGYILGGLACSMCLQRVAFALPLTLATPVAISLIYIPSICSTSSIPFTCYQGDAIWVIPIAIGLWIAQFLSTGFYVWKEQTFIMAKESSLFWLPSYNGAFLEQNLLLNRKNQITDEFQVNQREITKKSCVYICTTMYHETENEMEQLLHSLHDVDLARRASKRQIEAHIFFDGAVKGEVLNDFVLQLIGLVPKTLKVKIESSMKIKTPYGMQLRWKLPGGMPFVIHLKDNLKVKNKKRWSQTMYMSYVLDYKESMMGSNDDNTYILATDADVRFTHESVQALLDLMMRDPRVGAVCGRTHPLGSGPIVWYQVFDYAIGHWFQKVANHVLGSVLCSPGCFSVYRARAIREVLPIYATGVNTSVDFLTKDMGEDRWLCTLMVQSGWRLEYCAAAEDSTYCPETFDEFFKQRRRWIPSTLANLIQLIGEWKTTTENNDKISIFFIFYQALMVFSTLISPATVILVITGALHYVNSEMDITLTLVLLVLVTTGFVFVCLYTKQDFQLKVAKLLTVVFALLMASVTIGMAAQIGTDLHTRSICVHGRAPNSTTEAPICTDNLPADVSTLYLAGLVGIFLLAALLHPFEAFCLVHGIWYLFCLPSGYLLLIIYSVCNLTDRSWGTRETKEKKSEDEVPWYTQIWNKLKYLCMCCRTQAPEPPAQPARNQEGEARSGEEFSSDSIFSDDESPPSEDNKADPTESTLDHGAESPEPTPLPVPLPDPPKSAMKSKLKRATSQDEVEEKAPKWRFPGERKVRFDARLPKLHAETAVEDWLTSDLRPLYLQNFKENGYDNVSFIVGMTKKDLRAIGISKRGHQIELVYMIERIPHIPLVYDVPENVEDWLHDLGLESYWPYFNANGYTNPRTLEDLKAMDSETLRKTLKEDLQITKPAHVTKMIKAIKNLQYPTPAQREIRRAREAINKISSQSLQEINQDEGFEYDFWKGLREACLLPESAIFGAVTELKEKLEDLRDSVLTVFAIANAIWMILLVTLDQQTNLKLLGTNAIGFAFLAIYGSLIIIMFLTLIWHRMDTICHMLARAPWRKGPYQMSWSFRDADLPPEPTQLDLDRVRQHRLRKRTKRRTRRSSSQPLLDPEFPSSEYSSTHSYNHQPHQPPQIVKPTDNTDNTFTMSSSHDIRDWLRALDQSEAR